MAVRLEPGQLKRRIDPCDLDFDTTVGVEPLKGIIGQPRAMEALRAGLEMGDPTFHIFVAGRPGTGRTTAVRAYLEEMASTKPTPSDWVYLNNFADPYRPRACELPAGMGRELAAEMGEVVARARAEIPKAFESDAYTGRRGAIEERLSERRNELISSLGEEAKKAGFLLQPTPVGLLIVPVVDGEPLKEDAFQTLAPEVRKQIRERREALEGRVQETMKAVRELEREAKKRVEDLDREVALYMVGGLLEDLVEKFGEACGAVKEFLREMREDIVKNLDVFRRTEEEGSGGGRPAVPWASEDPFRRYEVNVVVDRSDRTGAPVVMEFSPTYTNLFGRIEKEPRFGSLATDFTMIRPGSLHEANGGFLVIPADDILRNMFAWDGLKRALRNRQILIEEMAERLGFTSTQSLRPEPIPLQIKVILIGTLQLYQILYMLDEDFNELFKVKAHFDVQMDRSDDNVRDFAAFLSMLAQKEGLKPFDCGAVGRIIEHAARLAEHQDKLSLRFAEVADVAREASHRAGREGAAHVRVEDVEATIKARVYRSNLVEERMREMITQGSLRIDTEGSVVGQINGLSVLSMGDYAFGRPSRISASLGLGRGGLVDIERQVKLGGPLHSKGVLILGGFLASRYSRDHPLTLSARLVFEQSYSGVDGDSASSAELYALLSALSDLPIRQDVAVTGSVDQQGNVQAIGGVNEKIEGFFDLCRIRGLTGTQGVMIPASNVQNLMLRQDVVEAVEGGQFHIWAVRTIDEGVAHLTGVPAGEPDASGSYPEGTVNALVDRRLKDMAQRLRAFAAEGGKDAGDGDETEEPPPPPDPLS